MNTRGTNISDSTTISGRKDIHGEPPLDSEPKQRALTTADLATSTQAPTGQRAEVRRRDAPVQTYAAMQEQLAPLFVPEVADDYRARWDIVQKGFVDDPRQAVRQGDELVAEVMKTLAETFSEERAALESQLDQKHQTSTETLRIALRRYRSFFERLLCF